MTVGEHDLLLVGGDLVAGPWPGPSGVRLLVEVVEHPEEEGRLGEAEVEPEGGIAGLITKKKAAIKHVDHKLAELQLGDVLLPPQIGLNLGPEHRERVVAVHDDVDEGVADGEKVQGGDEGINSQQKISERRHHRVVIKMQKREMRLLLAKGEEHGVEPVEELGAVVEVADPEVVHVLGGDVVRVGVVVDEDEGAEVRPLQRLHEEEVVDGHHGGVVGEDGPLEDERFPVAHQPRNDAGDQRQVGGHDRQELPRMEAGEEEVRRRRVLVVLVVLVQVVDDLLRNGAVHGGEMNVTEVTNRTKYQRNAQGVKEAVKKHSKDSLLKIHSESFNLKIHS